MQGALPHPHRRLPFSPAAAMFVLLSFAPLVFVAFGIAAVSRNIVYWDEFDTVLDLLIALENGIDARGFFERIFAINNEHRMITSRLLFAASWWLTGTVDFRVIGVIGNVFLVATCVILVVSAHTTPRRIRLGVLLAFLMFQFEHYENLLWSGASIDHFQVVALAVGAIALLARGTAAALGGACVLAVLATFTLAHGLVIWPVGAVLLWREGRRPALWLWLALALVTALVFFQGFQINAGHRLASANHAGVAHVFVYWLSLLGAPLALGHARLAPFVGLLGLALFVGSLLRGAWRRESVMLAVTLFCLAALGLIAIGRSEVAGGQLQSRYMVLSTLAWAMIGFAGLERFSAPSRPYRVLAACLPALVAFNVFANVRFAPAVESFVQGREEAALRFKQYGRLGQSSFRLYPVPERANQILKDAAEQGIYRMPRMCERTGITNARLSGRITYFIDEMTANTAGTFISGWAAIPDETSERDQIYLVLRSPQQELIFNTVSMSRPDVAAAYNAPGWRLCGFRFVVARWRLPAEELQIGLLIQRGDEAEYIMTEHRVRPFGRGEVLLANNR